MVLKNEVTYMGVWEYEGKFCTLVGSNIPDWDPTGRLITDEFEKEFAEVVYSPESDDYDPIGSAMGFSHSED